MTDSDTPPPDPYARLERAVRRLIDGGGDADYYRLEAAYWRLLYERSLSVTEGLQNELECAVQVSKTLIDDASRSANEAALYRAELAVARRDVLETRQGWAADIASRNGRD